MNDGAAARIAIGLGVALLAVGLAGCLDGGPDPGPEDGGLGASATGENSTREGHTEETDNGGGNETSAGDSNRTSGSRNETRSDGEGEPGNATYDPGWPPVDEASIRPGSGLGWWEPNVTGSPHLCTTGFVFSNPQNTTLYVSTAAHCVAGEEIGSNVTLAKIPGAGVLAYCSWGTIVHGDRSGCPSDDEPLALNRSRDNDFALIRVRDAYRDQVHPAMRQFHGPPGLDQDVSVGDKVLTYGNSPLRHTGPAPADLTMFDPREGYVTQRSEWLTRFHLVGHTVGGDSGSPVRTSDGALGLLIRTDGPRGIAATNLGPAVDFANGETDLNVQLKTWPADEDGDLPSGP